MELSYFRKRTMEVSTNPNQMQGQQEAATKPIFGRLIPNALLVAVVTTAEITLSSPLFAVLGFEYSALMGLALSFICGMHSTLRQNFTALSENEGPSIGKSL
ncbi:MAG TPA: hypothetical protein VG537_01090, partial [Candidatus Kapabacteria bacterium]|nr:hypothetical protein [Candidatus Kapabacteria bacterium]